MFPSIRWEMHPRVGNYRADPEEELMSRMEQKHERAAMSGTSGNGSEGKGEHDLASAHMPAADRAAEQRAHGASASSMPEVQHGKQELAHEAKAEHANTSAKAEQPSAAAHEQAKNENPKEEH